MKIMLLATGLLCAAHASAQTVPLRNATLQSDLDAAGHSITNLPESFIEDIGGAKAVDLYTALEVDGLLQSSVALLAAPTNIFVGAQSAPLFLAPLYTTPPEPISTGLVKMVIQGPASLGSGSPTKGHSIRISGGEGFSGGGPGDVRVLGDLVLERPTSFMFGTTNLNIRSGRSQTSGILIIEGARRADGVGGGNVFITPAREQSDDGPIYTGSTVRINFGALTITTNHSDTNNLYVTDRETGNTGRIPVIWD